MNKNVVSVFILIVLYARFCKKSTFIPIMSPWLRVITPQIYNWVFDGYHHSLYKNVIVVQFIATSKNGATHKNAHSNTV